MGISGKYVDSFKDANMASCVGIHLDGGYKHINFDVLGVEKGKVKLKSHWDGAIFEKKINRNKNGQQYAFIEQKGSYETVISGKPSVFRVLPFKGERF